MWLGLKFSDASRRKKYAKKQEMSNNKRQVCQGTWKVQQKKSHASRKRREITREASMLSPTAYGEWKRDDGKRRYGSETPWFVGMHEMWAGYIGGRRRKQNHKGEHSPYCRKVGQLGNKFEIKATMKITEKRINVIL